MSCHSTLALPPGRWNIASEAAWLTESFTRCLSYLNFCELVRLWLQLWQRSRWSCSQSDSIFVSFLILCSWLQRDDSRTVEHENDDEQSSAIYMLHAGAFWQHSAHALYTLPPSEHPTCSTICSAVCSVETSGNYAHVGTMWAPCGLFIHSFIV